VSKTLPWELCPRLFFGVAKNEDKKIGDAGKEMLYYILMTILSSIPGLS